jgi:hypothetical protein
MGLRQVDVLQSQTGLGRGIPKRLRALIRFGDSPHVLS